MALTRKMLKAMGIEEDKIEQIIEAHSETVNALKDERDDYKAKADMLPDVQKQLDDARNALAKHGDGEVVAKSEYDKIKNEYDTYKSEQVAKETRAAKERAVREFYKSAVGISEKRLDAIMKVTKLDDFELDHDGNIKNADEHAKTAKEEWADFVDTYGEEGAGTARPPERGGKTTKTKDEILAIKDGAARRQAMAENPTLFGLPANK